jgi:hypothetical protein
MTRCGIDKAERTLLLNDFDFAALIARRITDPLFADRAADKIDDSVDAFDKISCLRLHEWRNTGNKVVHGCILTFCN